MPAVNAMSTMSEKYSFIMSVIITPSSVGKSCFFSRMT